ncbi:hypothetical protein STAL104432_17790 [Streptomyces albus]
MTSLAAGSPASLTDIIRTSSGAANTAAAAITPRITATSVSSRFAYASPPSSSSFMDRTSCGTKTELRPPPTVRMYSIVGRVMASW